MVKRGKVGAPTKFTKKTREIIYELLAEPISLIGVCRGAHITTATLNNWRDKGYELEDEIANGIITEEDLDPESLDFLVFARKCDEIETELERKLVKDVYENEKGSKMKILGKRYAAFRDRSEIDLNHSGSIEIKTSWKDLVKGDLESE